ncbi:MAG: hypothetical protein OER43_17400 [Gammaproteobacteria bacterium]|nr:hypothetical protein [Gammaproteobacteria bacterium]MDH3413784.1 hypothetical protein [Gammaproteobacteria bacterium]
MVEERKAWCADAAIHRFLVVAVLALGLAVLPGSRAAYGQNSAHSYGNLEGSFVFSLSGSVRDRVDSKERPVSAVGRLTADGRGHFKNVSRVMNWGGQILRQVASGTYEVNADGTGTAMFNVHTVGKDGRLTPASIETLSFVMTGEASTIESIVTEWRGPGARDSVVIPMIRWVATKEMGLSRGGERAEQSGRKPPPPPHLAPPEEPAMNPPSTMSFEDEQQMREQLPGAGIPEADRRGDRNR